MNTQQLESFIQVAENLNFAHAAALLNVTQSAVSRQIHALEEELDTKLFYRTTRTVTLTPEGIIFLEHAKQILGQLQIATARIQHRSNLTARILRIGCESQADLLFLSEILENCRPCIHAFHPFLKVIPHRALMTLFYQGELDVLFGFREHLPIKNEILFTELRQVPLCCVLPQNHPYGEKNPSGSKTCSRSHWSPAIPTPSPPRRWNCRIWSPSTSLRRTFMSARTPRLPWLWCGPGMAAASCPNPPTPGTACSTGRCRAPSCCPTA